MDISFEPLSAGHLPMLATWLAAPHVRAWWPDPCDLDSVVAKYGPIADGTDSTEGMVIVWDGEAIGYIQCYRLSDEPQWCAIVGVAVDGSDAAGIDYLIGEADRIGRGLGAESIRAFVRHIWDRYGTVTSVVVAVQQANLASWKALERAGFRRVWSGVLDSPDPSDDGPAHLYVTTRDPG